MGDLAENSNRYGKKYVPTTVHRQIELGVAGATLNRHLSAVRGILKEARRLELIDRETMARTVDVAPIRDRRVPIEFGPGETTKTAFRNRPASGRGG